MRISVILFGIARDIVGDKTLTLEVPEKGDVAELKRLIVQKFPAFNSLNHLAIAVNNEYASNSQILEISDEIALIPPVSGG